MSIKYLLIVMGEPYSTFSEIIGKYFKNKKNFKKTVIIIGNVNLLKEQLIKLNQYFELNEIKDIKQARKNSINIINIKFNYSKIFTNISKNSNNYIKNSFSKSLEILRKNKNKCVLINGPISKKYFLNKKFLGITEYLSKNTSSKDEVMLIFNKTLSVSPITTHIPIKYVNKKITKSKICNNVLKINKFYSNILKKKSKFAILGLNPHCETIDKFSEEEKIIIPAVKYLKKKGIKIDGPFPADTFFFKANMQKYNVVIGMFHDQVLTPIKTLFNFKAINITLGLPFVRISPDHGPNEKMLGKNISNPLSLIKAISFLEKY